jgi:peptidoglycan/LPS O-acetylase OafA/YrhL
MPPLAKSDRLYLPQIDGLRFVAFFLVLIHHHVLAQPYFGEGSRLGRLLTGTSNFGWIGVDIFLTLSSFLIVTLLTMERDATGTISIRSFYIRRALRIWPLYFGFVIFAMILLPPLLGRPYGNTLAWHLFPYLTFTGNFSYAYFPPDHFAAHLWTISLEEQFYFVAPTLVLFAPLMGKSIRWLTLGMLALTIAFRLYIQLNQVKYPMLWVLTPCRLDSFIVGGVCSWIYTRRKEWLDQRVGWLLALLGVGGFVLVAQFSWLGGSSLDNVWQFTVVSLSAGCLILSSVAAAGTAPLLSWKPVVFLGKISFGLYVYHWFVLTLQKKFLPIDGFAKTPLTWFMFLVILFAGTTVLSVLSYYGFEKRFVRMKERFELVKSRPA